MANKYATIEIQEYRGKLIAIGTGKTPRGTKYVKKTEKITPAGPSKKDKKNAITAAVNKLMESGE